jgi:hypothetical protein
MEQEIILWNRFLKGGNNALGELYSDLFEPLVFVSFHYVNNNEIARDIVSNLFLLLFLELLNVVYNQIKQIYN